MFLRKLAISNLFVRKVRAGLTVAAVALSVSLVVSVTTGYASVIGAVGFYFDKYLGTTDAIISRQNDPHGPISAKVVDGLRADPAVRRADGRIELLLPVTTEAGEAINTRMVTVIGIERPGDKRIEMLRLHSGAFFDTSDGDVAVIDQALAEKAKLSVGSKFGLAGSRKTILTVVGIAHKPEAMAEAGQTMYIPLRTAQRFQGWGPDSPGGARVNKAYVELARQTDPRAFEANWKAKLPTLDPAAKLKLTRDLRDQLDKSLVAVELLSYLGGAVSMAAATFIVFSALSMGVSERQRALATLRAIGATKRQIAKLVVAEGLLLAGVGAAIGAPLGVFWIFCLSSLYPDVFTAGVVVSKTGMLLGVGGTMLTALAAGILPAWQATKVKPLEAMTPDARPTAARTPWAAAVAGLVLVSIDSLILFGPVGRIAAAFGPADPAGAGLNARFVLHFAVGLPTLMLGFFLLAPLMVKTVERGLGWAVAKAMGLNPVLLRQQLSNGLWRAAGTAAALMVGLAVLVVMQVQGTSAIKGWRLPTKFPDLFIVYPSAMSAGLIGEGGPTPVGDQPDNVAKPATKPVAAAVEEPAADPTTSPTTSPATAPAAKPGLFTKAFGKLVGKIAGTDKSESATGVEVDKVKVLESVQGIRNGEVMPIAIASPQHGHGIGSLILTALNPEATMFFGLDPSKMFRMMELEFRDGSAPAAQRYLEYGQAIWLKPDQTWRPRGDLVTTKDGVEWPAMKGAVVEDGRIGLQGMVGKVGDVYRVELPGGGVVEVPAGQVDGEPRHGRFVMVTNEFKELKGIGIGDPFPLKKVDGKVAEYTVVGVVWSPGIDVIVSVFDMGRQMDQRTANSVFGSVRDAKEDFGVERIYLFAANLDATADRDTVVKIINKTLRTQGMRAGDVRQIKRNIETAFGRLLLLASTISFAALAVAGLGVTNTVMAGIRTRRWQFGVLRSIGVTRGQLLRLVLAEAVLLGLVGCALGLSAGAVMVVNAHELQRLMTGYNPGVSVPWDVLAVGVAVVLVIAVAASLWPAVTAARSEPLKLLQAGRASA